MSQSEDSPTQETPAKANGQNTFSAIYLFFSLVSRGLAGLALHDVRRFQCYYCICFQPQHNLEIANALLVGL